MSLRTMLKTTATLKRKSNTKDASGGLTPTFTAVSGYSDVPCDIQPATGSVRMQYMQNQTNVSHTMFFQTDIGAKAGDILTSGSRIFQFRGKEQSAPGYRQWAAKIHVEEQLG